MSKAMQEEQRKQSRTFSVLLYLETETYDTQAVLAHCTEYFAEWAYIQHDCDVTEEGELKKPHIHVVGRLETSRSPSTVANKIGVPANYVECKKGYTFKKGVRYLVHLDDPGKYQYDPAAIVSNVELGKYIDPFADVEQAKSIFKKITEETNTSVMALTKWSLDEGCWSEFRRAFPVWKAVMDELYHREVIYEKENNHG